MYSRGEVAFKGALFHNRGQHRIDFSSATPEAEIYNNLKGLSDTDKCKEYVFVGKKKKELK